MIYYKWVATLEVMTTGPNKEIARLNLLKSLGIEDPFVKPNTVLLDAVLVDQRKIEGDEE